MRYDWSGRSVKYHRAQIREFCGFREATVQDGEDVASWLLEEVLPREQDTEKLRVAFYERCRALKIEPPTPGRVERLVASAAHRYEEHFCSSVFGQLSGRCPAQDGMPLLATERVRERVADDVEFDDSTLDTVRRSGLAWVKSRPGPGESGERTR